ncbi:MAG: DUF2235 domain-containing protein [Planctomycetota bacterium]
MLKRIPVAISLVLLVSCGGGGGGGGLSSGDPGGDSDGDGGSAVYLPVAVTVVAPHGIIVTNAGSVTVRVSYVFKSESPAGGSSRETPFARAAASEACRLELLMDGVAVFSRAVDPATNGEATFVLDLTGAVEGTHALAAALSGGGRIIKSADGALVIDRTAPSVDDLEPASGLFTNIRRPVFRGHLMDGFSGPDGDAVEVILDGTTLPGVSVAGEDFTVTPAADLADGAHTVEVRLRDRAGNRYSLERQFTVDTAPPDQSPGLESPAASDGQFLFVVAGARLTVTGALPVDGAGVAVSVPAPVIVAGSGAAGGRWHVDLDGIPAGVSVVTLRAVDRAGNHGPAMNFAITRTTDAISVTEVAPAAGAMAGGTALIIQGQGFTSDTDVRIGGASPGNVRILSPSEIRVVAPAGVEGDAELVVRRPDGAEARLAAAFRYYDPSRDSDDDGIADYRDPDPLVPFVVISDPADGILTNRGFIELSGDVDASAGGVFVRNISMPGAAAAAEMDAGGRFRAAGVPLAAGENIIEARAVDAQGAFAARHRITIRADRTSPGLTLSPPGGRVLDQAPGNVAALAATFTESGFSGGMAPATFRAWRVSWRDLSRVLQSDDDGMIAGILWNLGHLSCDILSLSVTELTGRFSATETGATLTDAGEAGFEKFRKNVVIGIVADKAGNVSFASADYAVDDIRPTAVIQMPVAGGVYPSDQAIPVTVQLADDFSGLNLAGLEVVLNGDDVTSVTGPVLDPPTGGPGTPVLATTLRFNIPAELISPGAKNYLEITGIRDHENNEIAAGVVFVADAIIPCDFINVWSDFSRNEVVVTPGEEDTSVTGQGLFAMGVEGADLGVAGIVLDRISMDTCRLIVTGRRPGVFIWDPFPFMVAGPCAVEELLGVMVKGARFVKAPSPDVISPGVRLGIVEGEILQASGADSTDMATVEFGGVVDDSLGREFEGAGPTVIDGSGRSLPLTAIHYPDHMHTRIDGTVGRETGRYEFRGCFPLRRGRNTLVFRAKNALGRFGVARAGIEVTDRDGDPLTNDFSIRVARVENAAAVEGEIGVAEGYFGAGDDKTLHLRLPRVGGDILLAGTDSAPFAGAVVRSARFVLQREGDVDPAGIMPGLPVFLVRAGDRIEVASAGWTEGTSVRLADLAFAGNGRAASVVQDGASLKITASLGDAELEAYEVVYGPIPSVSASVKSFDSRGIVPPNAAGETPYTQTVTLSRVPGTPVFRSDAVMFQTGSSGAGMRHRMAPEGRITVTADFPPGIPDLSRSVAAGGYRSTLQEAVTGNTPEGGRGVQLHNGEFVYSATDLAGNTAYGPGFAFTRTYRSRIHHDGPLGHGWDHVLNQRMVARDEDGDGDMDVVFYDGSGRRDVFTGDGNGAFLPPPGRYEKWDVAAGEARRLIGDGSVCRYVGLAARPGEYVLDSVTDRWGNRLSLFHDAAGRLVRVNDPHDRDTVLRYEGNGRISEIEDFAGRIVTFTYDAAGDLARVEHPDVDAEGMGHIRPAWRYTYETGDPDPARNHNMTAVTSPRGNGVLENEYDSSDRVVLQRTGPALTEFAYPAGETRVTDPRRQVWKFVWSAGHPELAERIIDPTLAMTYFEHTADLETGVVIRPLGNKIEYRYDIASPNPVKRGNLLETLISPDARGTGGSGAVLRTRLTWTAAADFPGGPGAAEDWNFVKTSEDEAGFVTTYDYDAAGNRVAVRPPGVTLSDGRKDDRTVRYRFNSRGQVEAVRTPDGAMTWHEYYPSNGRPADPSDAEGFHRREIRSVGRGYDIASPVPTNPRESADWLVTEYAMDSRGNCVTVTDETGRASLRVFDALDRSVETLSPPVFGAARNRTRQYFDADGNSVRTVTETPVPRDPGGTAHDVHTSTVTRTVDAWDRVLEVSEDGRVTTYAYDAGGLQIMRRMPSGIRHTTGYDARGLPERDVDGDDDDDAATAPAGARVVEMACDANGNVIGTKENTVPVSEQRHDGYDRLETTRDPRRGALVRQWRDNRGLVTRTAAGSGDAGGNFAQVENDDEYTHNEAGEAWKRRDLARKTADGAPLPPAEFTSDRRIAAGESVSYDPEVADAVTVTRTDGADRTVETNFPDGSRVTRVFNKDNTVAAETLDGSGVAGARDAIRTRTTVYRYNGLGHLVEEERPDGAITRTTRDGAGRAVFVTAPGGRVIHNAFNAKGELLSTTSGWGSAHPITRSFTYDDAGRPASVSQGDLTTEYAYDARGNVAEVRYRLGGGANVETERYLHDSRNRLVTHIRRDGAILAFVYDPDTEHLARVEDGVGRALREFSDFDAAGRPRTIVERNGPGAEDDVTTRKVYNSYGQLARDRQEAFGYFNDVMSYHADGPTNRAGNRTALEYPSGGFAAYYSHTRTNLLEKIGTAPGGQNILRYVHDGFGRIGGFTVNSGGASPVTAEMTRDRNGWLVAMNVGSVGEMALTRNLDGLKTVVERPGVRGAFGYDAHDRLTSAAYAGPGGFGPDEFNLDDLDNRTNGNLVAGTSTDYRITDSTRILDVRTPAGTHAVLYDARGNTIEDDHHRYVWDDFDRLARVENKRARVEFNPWTPVDSVADAPMVDGKNARRITIVYESPKLMNYADVAGIAPENDIRVEFKGGELAGEEIWVRTPVTERGAGPGGIRIEFLNVETAKLRITEIEAGGVPGMAAAVAGLKTVHPWRNIIYAYDGDGRRVAKIADNEKYRYVYDGVQLIEVRRIRDNRLLWQFVYGAAVNEPVAMYDREGGAGYFFVRDDLNSVLALTNAQGQIVEKYEYTAYGETRIIDAITGLARYWDDDADDANHDGRIDAGLPGAGLPATPQVPQTASDAGNPFGYAGMWRDTHTGHYHTLYREYSPEMGRWLTPDPAGYVDGQNLYAYYPGPNGVDPLGLALYAFDGTCNDRSKMKNPTNVAVLWDLYETTNEKGRFYIKGVGTNWWSKVFGGFSGIGAGIRLEKAYESLLENFRNHDETIDIIGFSRGAATALEFANMIATRGIPDESTAKTVADPRRPGTKVIYGRKRIPQIRFLGLFDTVASFGWPGNSWDPFMRLTVPSNVENVRHAVARDEVRSLFPLTSMLKGPGWEDPTGRILEQVFPGVHSDIGGGYDNNLASYAPLRWMWQQMTDCGIQMGELDEKYTQDIAGPIEYHDSRYRMDKFRSGWRRLWGGTYKRKIYYQRK